MGTNLSKYNTEPVPQNPPLVAIDPRFAIAQELTLIMRENFFSFTGGDFTIKDLSGVTFFKIDASALSLKQKKTLRDAYDQPVANFRHRVFDLFSRNYDIFAGSDESSPLFTIEVKFTFGSVKMVARIRNMLTGQIHEIVMKGNFTSLNVGIFNGHPKEGGVAIAKIHKPMFCLQDEFHLTIAPGVDAALIVFLCLALDEFRTEQKRRQMNQGMHTGGYGYNPTGAYRSSHRRY